MVTNSKHVYTRTMSVLDPAVVMKSGGRVVWLKEKGPEHVVNEYFIYCWLGRNIIVQQQELLDRIHACSNELGSLAIICRSYASTRDKIQRFHEVYLTGPQVIPLEEWNAHYQLLEEAVVDIESFFWFANRLLTHVALTLNYFFKKLKPQLVKIKGIRSHATFVNSDALKLLPDNLQTTAIKLRTSISDFRNEDIEHNMRYWRTRKAGYVSSKEGEEGNVNITFPPKPSVFPEKPLRELWIDLHDYLTEVAKFLGSQSI